MPNESIFVFVIFLLSMDFRNQDWEIPVSNAKPFHIGIEKEVSAIFTEFTNRKRRCLNSETLAKIIIRINKKRPCILLSGIISN